MLPAKVSKTAHNRDLVTALGIIAILGNVQKLAKICGIFRKLQNIRNCVKFAELLQPLLQWRFVDGRGLLRADQGDQDLRLVFQGAESKRPYCGWLRLQDSDEPQGPYGCRRLLGNAKGMQPWSPPQPFTPLHLNSPPQPSTIEKSQPSGMPQNSHLYIN